MNDPRFNLEWILPQEPGLATHVTLFDALTDPPGVLAVGHGADEADTLLDLWTTLVDRGEAEEAVNQVATAFERRTGKRPRRSDG